MVALRHTGLALTLWLALALQTASAASPPHAPARPRFSESQLRSSRASQLVAKSSEPVPQSSDVGETIIQIVNNVAGAGILTLSAGMSGGVGSVPATLLCLTMGLISGYTFYILGEACELTGETTFKGLWSRTLGASSSWVVDASIALMCLSAATIYSGILGDVITQLLSLTSLPAALNVRGANIIAITASALVPLSLLKDLSALGFTSALGCLAVLYTAVFITLRALDGSYALPVGAAAGGRMLATVAAGLEPSFKLASRWRVDSSALVLSSNLGLAYIAHYNAPAFYRTLHRRSPKRFAKVVSGAFLTLSLLYTSIMLLGYRTFGDNAASNLLRNYAQDDTLALLGRLATFVSILFGYPLAMVGLRDSASSVLETFAEAENAPTFARRVARGAVDSPRALTLSFLAFISAVAILLTDIGLVVGISGALLGAAIVYIFPALIYGIATDSSVFSPVYALVPLGAFLGLLGVWQTLK